MVPDENVNNGTFMLQLDSSVCLFYFLAEMGFAQNFLILSPFYVIKGKPVQNFTILVPRVGVRDDMSVSD